MNPTTGWCVLVAATLLGLASRPAKSEDSRQAEQIVLDLYAVEMSKETFQHLGFGSDDKTATKSPDGPVKDSPLLKDTATWNAALETAALLGAIRIQSAPTLASVSGRQAEIELHGVEFRDDAKERSSAVQIATKWSVTPTLTRDNKVRIEFHFCRSEKELTLEARAMELPQPVLQASSSFEIPFGKPTVVAAGVLTVETKAAQMKHESRAADKKPDVSPQTKATVIVITAQRVSPPAAEAPAAAEKPKLVRQVRLHLLVLETAPNKLQGYLKSSEPPFEALRTFLQKRDQEHTKAAAQPKNEKVLEQLIDPLKQAKIVKVISTPTLSTESGRETWFQVGGEFPFPVPANKAITIEYKKYGIDFRVTPDFISERNVRLTVKAQNTFLDYKKTTKIDSFTVPGLKTVAANSVHEVAYGDLLVFGPLMLSDDGTHGRDANDETGLMVVATPDWDWALADSSAPAVKEIRRPQQAAGRTSRRAR